ncbi:MAG: tetratricopeptide repeat protein, partial [Cyclobacteriaceae bacterium]
RQGNLFKADSISKLAIAKDPYNPDYYVIRGKILWSMNDTLQARENLLKSIELGPATATYQQLLEIYLAEKNYDDAFQVLNHLINLHPGDLLLQYRKAEIFVNIEEEEKAKTVYRELIERHPESMDAYYNLSDMYLRKLRYDSAIYFQNQIIARDSSNADPYLNLARIYERRFWYTMAINYYQRFLQIKPENLVAQQELKKLERKISYVNQLQQERERLSNASKLNIIKRAPKKNE